MKYSGWVVLLIIAVLIAGIPSKSLSWTVDVSTGFVATNPQIFPVGDMIDSDIINEGAGIDFGSLPELVYLRFAPNESTPDDTSLMFHLTLETGGITLINFWSQHFHFNDWINNSVNYTFTNSDIDEDANDWLRRNGDRTENADISTFLGLLDGANLQMALYTVTVEVYKPIDRTTPGVLVGQDRQTVQVYNPSRPSAQLPVYNDDETAMPVFFSWTWNGGPITTQDVVLIIVEADAYDPVVDPSDVIDSRTLINTRYEGQPQFTDYHIYTGATGNEVAFTAGKTYYWVVNITVPTVLQGQSQVIRGVPSSFNFVDTGAGGEGGDIGDEGDPQTEILFGMLSRYLSDEAVNLIRNEVEGYNLSTITFNGLGGRSLDELNTQLSAQGVTILTTFIE
ncbi:MAG: hypothetical protein P9L92_02730 [Candidatus Electryonea clarkiae]|nr:hypothetical protein [Candidatus Electryonea clarkiae]MDP8285814.1 hypothetical protein [Candidatus Electryonea clarkiae]